MKKINYIVLITLAGLMAITTSCSSDFEEVNTNPNDPSNVPSGLLLGGVLRSTADRMQDSFLAGEAGSCWVQHLGKTIYNSNELYEPRQPSIAGLWDAIYSQVIKDSDVMLNLAIKEENNDMQGVALVMKAYGFHFLTDMYGDIPMTEALKADQGLLTPVYDSSKEQVYPAILDLLDQAVKLLDGTGKIDAEQDIMYNGDASKWRKFANSLKFRVLMRASNSEADFDVSNKLKALVASGDMFTSNADEAKIKYLSAAPNANPFYENLVNGGRATEWSLGKELVDFMLDSNDPRLPVYAQKVGGDKDGDGYVGKPAGIRDIGTSPFGNSKNISMIGTKYLEAEQPAYLMTYAQLSLLMAEASERSLIESPAMAAKYYEQGIKASFEDNGITNAGGFDFTYKGGTDGLQQIAEQEWVALYMQGYEAWTEWRRTGFPVLPLAIDAVINSIPVRFNYPTTQQSLNNANYTAAVAKQGTDNLQTPLWWQKQ